MPELTPLPNPLSQCDRAVVAYLKLQNVGNGTPAHSQEKLEYPYFTVRTFQSQQQPDLTGNDVVQIQIQFKQRASTQKDEPNPESKRVELDRMVGLGMAAMMQSDDNETLRYTANAITDAGRALATNEDETVAANNSDMADFTLQNLHYKSSHRGEPDSETASWVEVRTFEATVCPSNVD